MEARLKAEIWVKAFIRKCAVSDVPAVLVRRGDDTAGVVLVKVNHLDGHAHVYAPARRGDGTRIWIQGAGGLKLEADIDAYIEKQIRFDPDIWVIEVEDSQGRHFLDEPVE